MLQKKIAIIVPKAKENYTNNFGYEILYSRISKLEITSLSPSQPTSHHSIVVSTSRCGAITQQIRLDPGSIPGDGISFFLFLDCMFNIKRTVCK